MKTSPDQTEVFIVRTGSANLASVVAALTRLGMAPRVTEDPDVVLDAPAVVLPGVGAFGAAMTHLRRHGLDEAIRGRVRNNRSLLAICLGMQVLCESSEESPGVGGLGVIPTPVCRFSRSLRVPHMGWNRLLPPDGSSLVQPERMYFAHSFRLENVPGDWKVTTTEYGGMFASAVERGTLLACQFHPELSGNEGRALIGRWLSRAMERNVMPC
ncbi:MAG TPA: imidazole glycerol phosphate synthase subunit HisH [Phycisphaerales bacterium]|nr:imidazole glycerol phosphate synthase subunit HisH [Phycisphaerales bacterium]